MPVTNFLIEISAINPATKTNTVIRMSRNCATAEGVYVDGKEWLPVITSIPEFSFGYWGEGRAQAFSVSYGDLGFVLDARLGTNQWTKLDFDGATATVWTGAMGADFASYRQIWTGALGPLITESSREARVSLLGIEAQLNRPALNLTYAGTGGVEGSAGLLGTLKPIAFGACANVGPVLLDPVKWVFHVDAYHACPINAVYSNALTLGAPAATVNTYSELIGLALTPGTWAACPAMGMFRLGGDPGSAKITADIGSVDKAANVAARLIKQAGVADAFLGTSFTTGTRNYSLYLTDDATIGDLVREALFAESRLLIGDRLGVFHAAPVISTKAAVTLASDGSSIPFVDPDSIVQEPPASPAWKVKIGHTPVFNVHGSSEISEAVATQGADLTAARAVAEQALQDAATADAKAAAAQLDIAQIVSDGVLSRDEKPRVVRDFAAETAQKAQIESRAAGYSISSTAFTTAYNALKSYLEGLSPPYTSTTQNTPIVAATYTSRWQAYWAAKTALLDVIATHASTVAGMAGTTIVAATNNFNTRNDRDGSAIAAPTIPTGGAAINHTLATDGSANIQFNWNWAGDNADIDGWTISVYSSTSSSAYTLGNTPAQETTQDLRADARQFWAIGVPADRYYTIYVQAYRVVDGDVAPNGIIRSAAVKSTVSGENPYRPSSNVSFAGNVTGSIGGTPIANIPTVNLTAPAQVTGVAVTSAVSFDQVTGAQSVSMSIEWTGIANVAGYIVAIADEGSLVFSELSVGSGSTTYTVPVAANAGYQVKVCAVSKANVYGPYSTVVTHTAAKDNIAPAVPTAFVVEGVARGFELAWTDPADIDLAGIEVWSHGSDLIAEATKITTVSAGTQRIRPSDEAAGVTKFFWLRSMDTSGNVSPFTASVSATTMKIEAVDLGKMPGDNITGKIDVASVPALPASIITTGELAIDRVAPIPADKLTAGSTLNADILLAGLTLGTVSDRATAGNTAAGQTAKYRTAGAPSNNPTAVSVAVTANTNGSRNIQLNWGAYTQGARQADFLMIFWKKASTTPTVNDTSVTVNVNTAAASYYIFEGLSPTDVMSFGIAAARRTESGIEIGAIQTHASWTNIAGVTPNYTANVNGMAAATLTAAIEAVSSDSVLSKAEKPDIVREYQRIVSSDTALGLQASALGVSTTALDTAFNALTTYLNSLSPAYTDFTTNTTIVPTTFNARFAAFYTAEANLNTAITAKAATLSTWGGVTGIGRPQDYAGQPDMNLAMDGNFALSAAGQSYWSLNGNSLIAADIGENATSGLRINGYGAINDNLSRYRIPVKPGDRFFVSARVWLSEDLEGAGHGLGFSLRNATNVQVSAPAPGGTTVTTTTPRGQWITLTGTMDVTLPDAITMLIRPTVRTVATTGYMIVSSIEVSRAQMGATKNIVTRSNTAPTSPNDGDIWTDTSVNPNVVKIRVSGAWQNAATNTTNTNQLTDGAGLGTKANWDSVANRPLDLAALDAGARSELTATSDGTTNYRATGVPTNNPTPSGITVTANSNGTRNIRLDWAAYAQGAKQADFLTIFWVKADAAPTLTDSSVSVNVTAAASYYIFEGVSPSDVMSFGIAAARRTENGTEIGPIQSPTDAPNWRAVAAVTPEYTGNINGVAASTLTQAISDVSSDAVLTTGEKPDIVREYQRIVASDTALGAQATALGVSTSALDTAFSALTTYLNGLTPAWNSYAANTPIVPATFNQKFGDFYTAEANLEAAVAAKTATMANWDSTKDRPTNLAGLDSTANTTLNAVNTGTTGYRTAGAPTTLPVATTIAITANSNGSRNIQLNWNAYTQGALKADFLLIFSKKGSTVPTVNDSSATVNVNTSGASYYIFEGVDPEDVMSFGIAAARRTEAGLEIGAIQTVAAWTNIAGATPNYTANVGGTAASTVVSNAATGAQNPATRINSGTTNVDAGRITISGGTSLASWRNGSDVTKIEGGSIATDTITATQIKLTDFSNFFLNPDWRGGAKNGWEQTSGGLASITPVLASTLEAPLNGAPTDYVGAFAPVSTATGVRDFIGAAAPVSAGDKIYYEGWVASTPDAVGTSYLYIRRYGPTFPSGTPVTIGGTNTASTTWKKVSGVFTVPADTNYIIAGVRSQDSNATGTFYWTGFRMRRMASAELIVDGAISAGHLSVGTLSQNLVWNGNPDQADYDTEGWYIHEGAGSISRVATSLTGMGAKRFGFAKTTNGAFAARPFPVVPGSKYRVKFRAQGSAPTANGRYVRMVWAGDLPANGLITSATRLGTSDLVSANSAWSDVSTEYEYTWTAPSTAKFASLVIYSWTAGPAELYVDNVEVEAVDTPATLIGPGYVHASSLVAKSITADEIAAGTITTDLMTANTIDGKVITAGTLDADKIKANTVLSNTITVANGGNLGQINAWAAAGNTAHGETTQYRSAGVPTNNPVAGASAVVANSNGSRNIQLLWNTYTQGALKADFLMIFWRKAGSTPTVNDSAVSVNVNTSAGSYYIFEGVSPADAMSFGIAAARRTENGVEIGPIQTHASWTNITGTTPNYTANLSGSTAASVVGNQGNFNSYNATFSHWEPGDTLPRGYVAWISGGTVARATTDNGTNGLRITASAGGQNGVQQTGDGATAPALWALGNSQWVVIEAEIILNSGTLAGSGILLRASNGVDRHLRFEFEKDVTGQIVGTGTAGSRYVFRTLVQMASGPNTRQEMFLMNHWTSFGSVAAANDITWIKAGWRFATESEIDPGKQINLSPASTKIDPGKIVVSGGTTLANWRNPADTTKIEGGSIATNTINATSIKANSISARELSITDTTNLIPNGDLLGTANLPTQSRMGVVDDASQAYAGKRYVLAGGSAAAAAWVPHPDSTFTVLAGDQLYLEFYAKFAAGSTGAFQVQIRFERADGTQVSAPGVAGNITAQAYTRFWGNVTVPDGAVLGKIQYYNALTAGSLCVGQVRLQRKNAGNLIVDGTITSNHLATGSVSATKIEAGAINATHLSAGSISASKLSVTGDNLFPDPYIQDINWWKGPTQGTLAESGRVNPANDANATAGGWEFISAPDKSLIGRVGGSKGLWQIWSGQTGVTGYTGTALTQVIPPSIYAKPSTTYEIGVAATNGSNKNCQFYLQFFTASGINTATIGLYASAAGDQSTILYRTKVTTDATCATIRLFWETPAGGAFSGHINVGNISIREAAGGTMIVNGAITTDHMTANTIHGDRITANTLSAEKIEAGTIQAKHIAGGVITTGHMTANTINGDRITAGTLNADKIAANTVLSNTITVSGGGNLGNINAWASAGNTAAGQTAQYRSTGVPTNNPVPASVTIMANTNGTRNLYLNWGAYTQGTLKADVLMVFWRRNTSAPGVNDSSVTVNVNTSGASYYIMEGVNPADTLSFGIAAARRTENGLEIGPIQTHSSWLNVATATPNFTANLNGTAASTVVSNAATGAQDPAQRINAGATTILPGKILIDSGGTTLLNWRNGADTTKIEGGSIATNTIQANSIVANSIGAREIAARSISATKLHLTDNTLIGPDAGMYDREWWNWGNDSRVQGYDGTGASQPIRFARITNTGGAHIDMTSQPIPVEVGATFRVKLRLYLSNDFAGWFGGAMHMPGQAWYSPAPTTTIAGFDGGYPVIQSNFLNGVPKGAWVSYTSQFTFNANATGNFTQFRTRAAVTAGIIEFAWEVTRASNAEMIVDGSITTNKMLANSIEGDRIKVNTLAGDRIAVNSLSADRIVANSIGAGQIAANSIGAGQIAASSITASKLALLGDNLFGDPQCQDLAWWFGPTRGTLPENGRLNPANGTQTTAGGWQMFPDVGTLGARVGGGKGYWQLWSGQSGTPGWNSNATTQVIPPSMYAKPSTTYELGVGCSNGSNKACIFAVQYFDISGTFITGVNPIVWSAGDQSTIYFRTKFTTPANCSTIRLYWETPGAGAAFSGFIAVGNISIREAAGASMIVDGSITANELATNSVTAGKVAANAIVANNIQGGQIQTNHMVADSINGDRIAGNTLNANKITAGSVLSNTITVAGAGNLWSIAQQAATGAGDPAARINGANTIIDPGKIQISGNTTLASWRNGADTTKIEGGSIAANTVTANKLQIADRAIKIVGMNIEVSTNFLTLHWTGGFIQYRDDNNNYISKEIFGGAAGRDGIGNWCFLYWTQGSNYFALTRDEGLAYGYNNVVIATWGYGSNLSVTAGSTIIHGDRITTNSITANRLSVNSLDAITANIGLLRTNWQGARTEIENNQIRVYNSSNVLVMRMGQW